MSYESDEGERAKRDRERFRDRRRHWDSHDDDDVTPKNPVLTGGTQEPVMWAPVLSDRIQHNLW